MYDIAHHVSHLTQPELLFPPLFFSINLCCCNTMVYVSGCVTMNGGFAILKLVVKMLEKVFTTQTKCRYDPAVDCDCEDDEPCLLNGLPEDVKKGHFVVHTVDGGELRRFVVELSYLGHPGFLKLLEQAEQEFGFKQTGILAIPCRYSDLQSVLQS